MSSISYRQPFVHPAIRSTDVMRIGPDTFRYGEVAAYEVFVQVERDWAGQWLCCALYGFASLLLLIGVLIGSLDLKYLIAVVFMASICLMSFNDALGAHPVTVYILDMTLFDGRQFRFMDADEAVVDTLAGRIEAARRGWA